ncbi:metal ABC transporter solute-binding protein, Zn/Mn family [Oceanobacillus sp. CFH 90083]|uniref:metal ABC transporter solute-binding protein, Zn/Mn family n=1 Tax=Oceanobacillus sp. CFH 90083 TaxID=2592336 RepID=UPI00128D09D7|nr:zinc ABC transporter substrate-binding protein [Oceanobacillus sp. CFH 90083]
MENVWKKALCLAMVIGILFLAACGSDSKEGNASEEEGDEPIEIVTTIAQIGEPLSVIGGDLVHVESLMGPSVDPHLYNPTQSDISKLYDADIIFFNGLNLEANMVEPLEAIGTEKPVLAIGETLPESVLLDDEEEAGATDPHIWFDYHLWQDALDAAVEELKEYAPEHADTLEAGKQEYFAQLQALDEEAAKLQDIPEAQRVLVTAHDAFGYFGKLHDIEVIGLQGLSTESEIGVSDINDTITIIAENQVPAIFVESSVNQDSINAVIEGAADNGVEVEVGGELYSDAMGEAGSEEGTYIGMYKHNIDTIYEALSGGDE